MSGNGPGEHEEGVALGVCPLERVLGDTDRNVITSNDGFVFRSRILVLPVEEDQKRSDVRGSRLIATLEEVNDISDLLLRVVNGKEATTDVFQVHLLAVGPGVLIQREVSVPVATGNEERVDHHVDVVIHGPFVPRNLILVAVVFGLNNDMAEYLNGGLDASRLEECRIEDSDTPRSLDEVPAAFVIELGAADVEAIQNLCVLEHRVG